MRRSYFAVFALGFALHGCALLPFRPSLQFPFASALSPSKPLLSPFLKMEAPHASASDIRNIERQRRRNLHMVRGMLSPAHRDHLQCLKLQAPQLLLIPSHSQE